MAFAIENFILPQNLEVIQRGGLHKLAGAMTGFDELTLKEAVAIVGAKALQRRREMHKIAQGLDDLAVLAGEKLAGDPWHELLGRAAFPAAAGAGIALASRAMSPMPMDSNDALMSGGTGALLGGVAGAGAGLARALRSTPDLAAQLAQALRGAR
jgi:hypothetical protein